MHSVNPQASAKFQIIKQSPYGTEKLNRIENWIYPRKHGGAKYRSAGSFNAGTWGG